MDSTYVGRVVGSPWEFQHYIIFRYGHMKVVEVLLGTPEVEVDKLNQGSSSKSPTSLLIPGLLLIHQYVRFITEKSPKYDILQNN